jgi:hypothetical protein
LFYLVGAAAIAAVSGKYRPHLKSGGVLAASFVLTFLPWMLYQRLIDPPGDALVKRHVAGRKDSIPDQSALKVIIDAHLQTPAETLIFNRWSNVEKLFGPDPLAPIRPFQAGVIQMAGHSATARQLSRKYRAETFFHFSRTISICALGAMLFIASIFQSTRPPDRERLLYGIWFMGVAFWCVVLFGPGITVNHAGALALNLTAYAACFLTLWRWSPTLASIVAAFVAAEQFLGFAVLPHLVQASTVVQPVDRWSDPLPAVACTVIAIASILLVLRRRMRRAQIGRHGSASRVGVAS